MQVPRKSRSAEAGVRLEARCAWCGVVRLDPDDLGIRTRSPDEGLYEYNCPSCGRLCGGPLDRGDLSALAAVGVEPSGAAGPFELFERHSGPPISLDDILDFHQAIWSAGSAHAIPEPAATHGHEGQEEEAA